jgi:hypothetical protein
LQWVTTNTLSDADLGSLDEAALFEPPSTFSDNLSTLDCHAEAGFVPVFVYNCTDVTGEQ